MLEVVVCGWIARLPFGASYEAAANADLPDGVRCGLPWK
jgi:hypothetical protein